MSRTPPQIAFIDSEIGIEDHKVRDLGAVRTDGSILHSSSVGDFARFIADCDYVCGHNIIHHDLPYIDSALGKTVDIPAIDTLYLSPLLFPKQPYHALVKDDKLKVDELNNPVNDSKKARKLFYDEVNAYDALPMHLKQIFGFLLGRVNEFKAFFAYVGYRPRLLQTGAQNLIRTRFAGKLCTNADLSALAKELPVELAYALALIWANDADSITPPWLQKTYPRILYVLKALRHTPCVSGCAYCKNNLNIHRALKRVFGFDEFRLYGGDPLQERAVQSAVNGDSLLAVFPTGGGKSLAFQLPALMAAEAVRGLTVVISPLQSLMKDQVDNLIARGVTCAVTINGSLDPIERANALEQITSGSAHLLYISPEQLRSRTIERLLASRHVVRFVIDEAHCFSAWGQDFRVDYLYIGDFIHALQEKRPSSDPIPVSCFTATAKQKVISDIRDYFNRKVSACLIQSLGRQFRLSNLVEVRFFLLQIGQNESSAIVPKQLWDEAKEKLLKRYAKSANLNVCLRLIGAFEKAYPQRYRSDLDEFIHESQLEDFFDDERAELYVSTIHKAKGREFDTVYMLLQNCRARTDEELRVLYVGMTRAKNDLHIHCNAGVFDQTSAKGVQRYIDTTYYGAPNEMLVQLTHRDVFLGYFKLGDRQHIIQRLYSGMRLTIDGDKLLIGSRDGSMRSIARFSRAFYGRLCKWMNSGYHPVEIVIRHILWWKGVDDENETLIFLPTIKLRRM